jgi:hypothetical protein
MPIWTFNAYLDKEMQWESELDPTLPINEFQSTLSPYFPQWQRTLAVQSVSFRAGRHIFKVSMSQSIWRRIAIEGEATLRDLSALILQSVEFDSDHLDQIVYTNLLGRKVKVVHPYADGQYHTTDVKISSLPLAEGSMMEYVFDFGDWWKFEVLLETIVTSPSAPEPKAQGKKSAKRSQTRARQRGEIIEVHGEAPPQYPSYEE